MIFNLILSALQQVELHRSCYLVGMGVRGRGGNVFKTCSMCGWGSCSLTFLAYRGNLLEM